MSNADFRIAKCIVDGGHFPYTPTPHSPFQDWRGNCIYVGLPSTDQWNKSPVIEILRNELVARGLDAWGGSAGWMRHRGVAVADNTITCASASYAGYAGGVQLAEGYVVGCNRNTISRNTIQGTGGWAIDVEAFDLPSERNSFVDNVLVSFCAQEAGGRVLRSAGKLQLLLRRCGSWDH